MIINFRNIIGECFVTNEGYNIQIIDYVDTKNVLIKFVDRPEIQIWSTLQNIKNGQVKNPLHKSVYNIGYYGIGNYTARKNGIKTDLDNRHILDVAFLKIFVTFKILQNGIHIINMNANTH